MIFYFIRYCDSLKQVLAVTTFFKGIELICNSSCRHSFDERLFFCYKREIAVISCRAEIIGRRYHSCKL